MARVAATQLRAAALIEGLRLDEPTHVAGVLVSPVPHEGGFAGRELRETFNALLADHGFVSEFERPQWGVQLAPRRRLCFVSAPPLEVPDLVEASGVASARLAQLVDALALTHGGAPTIFAEVHEQSQDGVRWEPFALMVGGGVWPGTHLERLLASTEALPSLEPADAWRGAMADPLVGLWLSLHRGLAGERRWDVKILRCCTLLEAIARESSSGTSPLVDEQGRSLLGTSGQLVSPTSLRGRLFVLVREALSRLGLADRFLRCHEMRTLWEEVGVWADVRNMVAHEGLWKPPPLPTDMEGHQGRTAEAFELAGRGDGLESGWQRYTNAVSAATEVVLRARIVGDEAGQATSP